jgi:hypothetical protein
VNATKVMGIAIAAGVIGRWANNKKALPPATGVLQIIGALVLVSLLDQGKTEPVAKGFAWLFAVAVVLSPDSPLTGLAHAEAAGGRVPDSSGAPGTGGGPFPGAGAAGSTLPTGTTRTGLLKRS